METDSGLFSYSYDPLGRLTEASHDQESRRYSYDSLGNRIMSSRDGILTYYRYNARSQLVRSWTGEDITEYGYDARGNQTQVTVNGVIKEQYTYDATNRMTEAVIIGRSRGRYVYNGLLQRVKKWEVMDFESSLMQNQNHLDSFREQLHSPFHQEELAEKSHVKELSYILDMTRLYNDMLAVEGEENRRFIWGRGLLLAEGDNPLTYLCDHLGSPVRLLKEDQESVFSYDEFGIPVKGISSDHSIDNFFGHAGEYTDLESNIIYLRARYYSPVTGRFLAEDPSKDGLNWYTYCMNNPINYVDFSGMKAYSKNFVSQYGNYTLVVTPREVDAMLDIALMGGGIYHPLVGLVGTVESAVIFRAGGGSVK